MNKPAHVLHKTLRRFNRNFFDSLLPVDDIRVWWNDGIKDYGLTQSIHDNDTGHLFFDIYIDPNKHHGKNQVYSTLLHEMAHVKLYPWMKHGIRHDEELLRLAIRGAFKGLW